jgi:hypothetical protein
LAALCASVALAEDFKTVNGKEYKNATVSRVETDGIVLRTKSGITKVYFTELPKEVQQRFGYDPEKVAALQKKAEESEQKQAEPTPSVEIISVLANRVDDKIKAVLNSPQMQKAKEAQNSEEQIAVIKNSDLYKRGYAKQSTAVKITVSDAERDFAGAESELRREESLPRDLIEGAGLAAMEKHVNSLINLMGAVANTKQRLFDLYALIMKDGE